MPLGCFSDANTAALEHLLALTALRQLSLSDCFAGVDAQLAQIGCPASDACNSLAARAKETPVLRASAPSRRSACSRSTAAGASAPRPPSASVARPRSAVWRPHDAMRYLNRLRYEIGNGAE